MKCPNCGKEMRSKMRDYEYIESGLKNVVLKNIRVHDCKACGELLPEISNVKQINAWIAEYRLNKRNTVKTGGPGERGRVGCPRKSPRERAQRKRRTASP